MKKLFLLFLASVLVACEKTEDGPELTEPAVVEDTIFAPSQHGTGIGHAFTGGKSGGGVAVTSVDIAPKWAVVFHCQHGKFVIEGERKKHEQMWKSLIKGQKVLVHYKEIYALRAEGRVLIKYDFLSAEPTP